MALSRARLGLYILGRREIFESCYELREAFEVLLQRPDKLSLVTGELWPSERVLADEGGQDLPGEAVMEGVEHIGQYVFEMTNTRIQQLQAGSDLPEAVSATQALPEPGEEDLEAIVEEDEEDEEAAEAAHAEGFEAEED